jgi:hypothetical protein
MSVPDPKNEEWRRGRARLDVVKTVKFERMDALRTQRRGAPDEREVRIVKNDGLPASGQVTFRNTGECPCRGANSCGHTYMYECEENDCRCCTATCN